MIGQLKGIKARSAASALVPALLALLFAASCYWQGPSGSGAHITLKFPPVAKAVSRVIAPSADTLRIYLLTGGTFYAIGPAAHLLYDEVAFSSGMTYSSPAIPAGLSYSVLVAVGKISGGVFTPLDYGNADGVLLSAGGSTDVAITLQASPVFDGTNLWGQAVTGVRYFDYPYYSFYASTTDSIYGSSYTDLNSFVLLFPVPAGYSINGFTAGQELSVASGFLQPTPWLNTNKGILPFSLINQTFDITFASGAAVRNIPQSASLSASTTPPQIAVYQSGLGIGGSIAGASPTWADVDLSGSLGGKPINDMVSLGNEAYFATNIGGFTIDSSAINALATEKTILADATRFTTGDPKARISSLAIARDTMTLTGYLFYMGSPNGVYFSRIDLVDPSVLLDPPKQIPETAGLNVRMMRAVRYHDYGTPSGYHAILAVAADLNVYIFDVFFDDTALTTTTTLKATLPFYSGLPTDLPTDLKDMILVDTGSWIYLLVAGNKGLISYLVAAYNAG